MRSVSQIKKGEGKGGGFVFLNPILCIKPSVCIDTRAVLVLVGVNAKHTNLTAHLINPE